MTSVYIAAPLANYALANGWAHRLSAHGHQVTSAWHYEVRDLAHVKDPEDITQRFAILDTNLAALHSANLVLAIMYHGIPKATYAEIGYALALNKPIVWLRGACRCIFDAHPLVSGFDDELTALAWVNGYGAGARSARA